MSYGSYQLGKNGGTRIFCEEANPDMSVSFTNSVFAKNELVRAFLKKTNPQQKCLIAATDETRKL